MLLILYKNAVRLLAPMIRLYLQERARRGKEDVLRAHERRGRAGRARPEGTLVWCHAASVGESLSLLSVVEELLRVRPDIHVLVTTGTVTSAGLMAKRLPAGAFHQYIPVDHPAWVERFLNHWRPDLVLWAESELWPNMLSCLRDKKVPALLLNARMSEKTYQRWRRFPGLSAQLLGTFQLCFAQNAQEAQRLKDLGAPCVEVGCNLKYAATPLPHDTTALQKLKDQTQGRALLLFASTHAGEEELAFQTHQKLMVTIPNLLTVVVPRHPSRAQDIMQIASPLRRQLRSVASDLLPETQVYIADTMGELGLFYRLCKIVVMGGSFADIGGHNPIEAAQCGALIIFGPSRRNFVGICEDFKNSNGMIFIDSAEELGPLLQEAFTQPARFDLIAQSGYDWVSQKSNIARDLVAQVASFLPKNSPDMNKEVA